MKTRGLVPCLFVEIGYPSYAWITKSHGRKGSMLSSDLDQNENEKIDMHCMFIQLKIEDEI